VDLLADADCLKCGYALRGLTEYRCPECGTPFDPADFVDTFVPKWPKLFLWLMVGMLGAVALQSGGVIWVIGACLGRSMGPGGPLPGPLRLYYAVWGVQWMVTLGLSCLVVKGLRHGSDWARWVAIAMFLTTTVLTTGGAVIALVWTAMDPMLYGSLFLWHARTMVATVFGNLIPSLILTVYLATGLRRESLGSDASTPPRAVKTARFNERSDWLLLIRLYLIMAALRCVARIVGETAYSIGVLGLIEWLAFVVGVFGCSLAARRTWRNPVRVRGYVCAALACVLIAEILGMASYVEQTLVVPGYAWTDTATGVLAHLASVLPCLALVLFVFKGINRDDIERVARLPRKSAAPAGMTVAQLIDARGPLRESSP